MTRLAIAAVSIMLFAVWLAYVWQVMQRRDPILDLVVFIGVVTTTIILCRKGR